MSSYLLTGGCGFIGSHLADALVGAGHRVRILDDLSSGRIGNAPEAAELVVGDVADEATVRSALRGVDGCFHLAAVASVQRSNEAALATHRSNLGGTVCILEAARSQHLPVVYASSAAVYGHQATMPIREDARLTPLTAYGADKLGGELHARVAGLVHGVATIGLRFFNVYGPRQDPLSPYSGVISIFADRILRGAAIDIHGDGTQVRDFVYVGDVVRFLLAAMQRASPEARVLNVCTGRPTSILSLVRTIAALCGGRPQILHIPRRIGDIDRSVGAPEEAARHLGVTARVELSHGLEATLRSLAEHREVA